MLHTLPIPRGSEVNAILQIGWRDNRHPFAEGHINPSTTTYLEWDLGSGDLVDEKIGSWFAVSPDGHYVAQQAHVPHGAPPPHDSSWLLIDDKVIYPRAGVNGYHHFVAGLAWSDDSSRLALVDQSAGKTEVVFVNPVDGKATQVAIPTASTPNELSWSGPNTITLRRGGEAWRVDAVTGGAERVKDFPVAPDGPAVPSTLKEALRGMPASLEDSRCR